MNALQDIHPPFWNVFIQVYSLLAPFNTSFFRSRPHDAAVRMPPGETASAKMTVEAYPLPPPADKFFIY
jgi:hypothetical protein